MEDPMPRISIQSFLTMIATLFAGVIFAGSCGGGGGGGPSVHDLCNAYCSYAEECDDFFDEYYDDTEECVDDCVDERENYWDEYEPAQCDDEAMDLEICGYELEDCDDMYGEAYYDECEDEMEDLYSCWENASDIDADSDGDSDIDGDADADSDSDSDWENIAACEEFEATYNSLECVTDYMDWYCENYEGYGYDITGYFYCLEDVYYCQDGYVTYDDVMMEECYTYLDGYDLCL
jgi:hypothetical protein